MGIDKKNHGENEQPIQKSNQEEYKEQYKAELLNEINDTYLSVSNHREPIDEKRETREYKMTKIHQGEENTQKSIKIKINPEGDIKAYETWIPDNIIGEQFFNQDALKRLGITDKLPQDIDVIQKITGTPPFEIGDTKYQEFYERNIKDKLPGYYFPDDHTFHNIGEKLSCWIAGGYCVVFEKERWHYLKVDKDYFLSVRLFLDKNLT